MKFLTDYEIHIFGMNRCGQHAILSWMLGMFEDVLFKNNMGAAEFKVDPVSMRPWPFYHYENYGEKTSRKKWEVFAPGFEPNAIILGTENAYIDKFATNYNSIFNRKKIPEILRKSNENGLEVDAFSKHRIFISVIRSPHNHAASCLKWRGLNHFINKSENFIPLWKSYAKEHLGITDYLPEIAITLDYDKWFLDDNYRRELFDQMNLDVEYSEKNLNKVLGFGKGSSFNRQASNGKANRMKVLNRWEYWMKEVSRDNLKFQRYLEMLNDDELQDFSKQIYGEMPFIVKDM